MAFFKSAPARAGPEASEGTPAKVPFSSTAANVFSTRGAKTSTWSTGSRSSSASTTLTSATPVEEPSGVPGTTVGAVTGVSVAIRTPDRDTARREKRARTRVLVVAWCWGMLPGVLAGAAITYSLWPVGTRVTKSTEKSPDSPAATTPTQSPVTVPSPVSTIPTAATVPVTPAPPTVPPPTVATPTVAVTTPTVSTVPSAPTVPSIPATRTIPTVGTVPTVRANSTVPTMSTVPTVPTVPTVSTVPTMPTVPVPQPTAPRATIYPGGPRLAAEYLNVSLNWTLSPCDDFYGFVCGRFNGPYLDVLSNLGWFISGASKALLLTIDVPPRNQTSVEKAAGLFQACLRLAYNATASEAAALRSFLKPIGLDVSNMAPDPKFIVLEKMAQLSMEYGFPSLVKFSFVRRPTRSKKILDMKIFDGDKEWILTSHQTHRDRGALAAYYEKYLKFYDSNMNFTALTSRIIAAEKASEWVRIYKKFTDDAFDDKDVVVLWDNATAVAVFASDTSRLAREEARVLMAWSVLRRLVVYTSGRAMRRLEKPEDVEDFCLDTVSGVLEMAVTRRYVSTYTPQRALSAAKTMALRMIATLADKLSNTGWIVDPVRNNTLRKARNLRLIVGYPKHLENASELEQFYASFPDTGVGFVKPYLETHRHFTSRMFKDNATENFTTGVANAEYSAGLNAITIQAGIVQPPVYFPEGTAALNYGGLGQIIGHEIMHGYDVDGIKFDEDINEVNFKNTSTMMEYERKVLCLRKSYQNAERNARQLDTTTDSEGFADYTGLLLAYAAYKSLPVAEQDRKLSGLDLSADKTFFISHCLKWCDLVKKRSPGKRYWAGRSRCIVPLQNMPEFAAAFRCKTGDPMSPADRCDFW
ncbi:neprilysin-2-like isoform X2 [Dermacentor albipictus]|uniref:neprilysin-2-like isoform X2 n=1 Tax=Dermacentor albipictus TaxID=60249 RepID=UPI0038FC0B11